MRKVGTFLVVMASLLIGLVSLPACDSDVGEECDEEGRVGGECVDGAVCGRSGGTTGSLMCLKQCNTQADCSTGEDCNGVGATSLKGCRPR